MKWINCMNDSRYFQEAESVRSGHSHITSQNVNFSPHPVPGGMLSRSFGMPSRREGPPSIWDTHGTSGNVYASPDASSTAPYPQELTPWSSGISEPIHSTVEKKNENRTTVQDQRCQSGPRRIQSSLVRWNSSKNNGADQRLQISDLHFDKYTTQRLLVGRWGSRSRYVLVHNFLRKQCIGSKKWGWFIQWMIWNLRYL